MKNIFVLCLLFLSVIFYITGYAKSSYPKPIYAKTNEESLDQIVAIVNDDVVTKSELNRALTAAKIQIAQEHIPAPQENVFQKQVLDQLINKKLQLQIAKQAGMQVPDELLNKAIESIAKQNQMSVGTFYQRVNQEGITTQDYRSDMRDQLTLQKLQQQEVISRISITPEEVTSFMHSKVWQENESKEYHLEDILIPLADAPSSDDIIAAKQHAQAIVAKLNQGQNFRTIAQSESSGTQALQGGDLGWRKLPEIPSAFADQVAHMQANEIAGPIQTANGFHVIRLAAVRATGAKQASAPDRKQIENLLMQRKFEEAMQSWVSKLRSEAYIVTNPEKA